MLVVPDMQTLAAGKMLISSVYKQSLVHFLVATPLIGDNKVIIVATILTY